MTIYLRYCPACGEEYQPHMTHCIECGGVLKEKLDDGQWPERRRAEEREAEAGLPPGDYQKLVIVPPSTATALMPSFLEAGIPIKVEPSPHGLRLSARAEDRSAAMSILEEEGVLPRQPDHSEPAVAAEGGPCPACGQTVRPGTSECPECGLALSGHAGCESCGEPLAPDDHVCPSCGQPVSHVEGE